MKKIKVLLSIVLVLAMVAPLTVYARIEPIGDVRVGTAEEIDIDGKIDAREGWGDPVVLDATNLSAFGNNRKVLDSMVAYMAYDFLGLYVAAEITDISPCPSDFEYVNNDDFGFIGDTFAFTIDPLCRMSNDQKYQNHIAPIYSVSYDENGNSAIYRSHCGERSGVINEEESLFTESAVQITDTGWSFELYITWSDIFADIEQNTNGELSITDPEDIKGFFSQKSDNKMSFLYASRIFDEEAFEDITDAVLATAADPALDGMPAYLTNGLSVKTFGINYYIDHEDHITLPIPTEIEQATFEKDGKKIFTCLICGDETYEVIPRIPFTDVDKTGWYAEPLKFCYSSGLIAGTSATTFSPSVDVTRAMFVQILSKLAGVDLSMYDSNKFKDVAKDAWYYHAVAWANEYGIVSGTSATTFSPNTPITRQDMATMLKAFAESTDLYKAPQNIDVSKYTDFDLVAPYAKEAILWVVENGIMTGTTETTLSPRTNATRAQTVTMVAKFYDYLIARVEEEFGEILG